MGKTSYAEPESVAQALVERGVYVKPVRTEQAEGFDIWMINPEHRYSDDTLWPPFGNTGWLWGDMFQYSLPNRATPEEIAEKILDTVRGRP